MHAASASRFGDYDGRSVAVVVRCGCVLFAVLMIGTIGFKYVEPDWTFWRALYFTTITITTVGYGDEGLSPAGQPFAVFLVLFGIATASYSFSQIVQFAVTHSNDWKRVMNRDIARLSGHVVVCGFGRMGRSVCERLAADGVDLVIVNREGSEFDRAVEHGYLGVAGCATDDEALLAAGADRARGVVCCTSSDADNVFVTLSVRRMNPDAFIACRADAPESVSKMHDAGADVAISPHCRAGLDLAHALQHPNLARMMDEGIGDSPFALVEITVDSGSRLDGRTIVEIGGEVPSVSFVALQRGNATSSRPSGTDRLAAGDVLIAAGRHDELASLTA